MIIFKYDTGHQTDGRCLSDSQKRTKFVNILLYKKYNNIHRPIGPYALSRYGTIYTPPGYTQIKKKNQLNSSQLDNIILNRLVAI